MNSPEAMRDFKRKSRDRDTKLQIQEDMPQFLKLKESR